MDRRSFLILCSSTLVAGCMSMGTKVDQARLYQFTPGTTTYLEVVAALGKPNYETKQAAGPRQITYSYTQTQFKAESFIPIVSAFVRGTTSETTNVVLDFDARDVLMTYSTAQGQTQSGQGLVSGAKQ